MDNEILLAGVGFYIENSAEGFKSIIIYTDYTKYCILLLKGSCMTNFIKYKFYSINNIMLGMITWASLGTFMIVSKTSIGTTNIPIFEVLIFISGLVGVRIAHTYAIRLQYSILLEIITETVILIALFTVLLSNPNDLALAGVLVYIAVILRVSMSTIVDESTRRYEDAHITTKGGKWALQKIRRKTDTTVVVGGGIGASISLICLTYFGMDIVTFTLVMLVLNTLVNIIDYYLLYKYLM